MLIVAKGFTVSEFAITVGGCLIGIAFLAAALSRFMFVEMRRWEQALCGIGAVLMVAPGLLSTAVGLAVAAPAVLAQIARRRVALT